MGSNPIPSAWKKSDEVKFEEFRKKVEIKASVREKRYVICKMGNYPKLSEKIFAVIKDGNETTVVAEENHGLKTLEEEKFFKIITFEIKLPFDLIGFMAYISKILANQNISIFPISAYSTDHILVKENDLGKTLRTLKNNEVKIIAKEKDLNNQV